MPARGLSRAGEPAARRLFPALAGARCALVDMDAELVHWRRRHPELFVPGGPNPFLDPVVASGMLDEVHRLAGVGWSYGGYLEDRARLLAGSYLDATGGYLHLGVDFNVPQGTPVVAGIPSRVVLVDDDGDRDGGWGLRVFLRRTRPGWPDMIGIFAHLQAARCQPGDALAPDEAFAEVGGPPDNGNWHPHLHLQLLRAEDFQAILGEHFAALDGYGQASERAALAARFPNPLEAW